MLPPDPDQHPVLHGAAAVPLLVAAFASILAGAPFPVVIAAAAGAGIAIGRTHPAWLGRPAGHAGEGEDGALPSAQRPAGGMRRRIAIALAVWLVPVAAVIAYGGVWGDLAWFFTVAALITFGGAYAVLPFVASVAVSHFGWLTANQMVAGLGLGETTPGPLILVNTFVGYLAGYHAVGSTAGGVAGAAVATYATFAPSFVFILAGAP